MVTVEEHVDQSRADREYNDLMNRVQKIPYAKSVHPSGLRSTRGNSTDSADVEECTHQSHRLMMLSTFIMSVFMTFVIGFMEFLVVQKFPPPSHTAQWTFDYSNSTFIAWLQKTLSSAAALLPITYATFRWKSVKLFNVILMAGAMAASTSIIYIVRFVPTYQYYSYLPGLSALWILFSAQMSQATSFLALCCSIITYYLSSYQ